jgi:hypothetical protein
VKALSIRQPWAWFILHAGKNVENRGTRWVYRGPVLIHVGASLTKDEYRAWRAAGESMRSDPEPRAKVPEYSEMQRGGFVGVVRITDCVQHDIYDRDPAKNAAGWRMGSDEHGPSSVRWSSKPSVSSNSQQGSSHQSRISLSISARVFMDR